MAKTELIWEGQMTIFDFLEPEPPKSIPNVWQYLRYGPHTLVPEARERCKKYLDANGAPADFKWNNLPCENCEYSDGRVCRSGGHSCHYEYGFLICDGFKQTIQQELGHFYPKHGKRLSFDELADYKQRGMAVLINCCTESQAWYKLIRIVEIDDNRAVYKDGTTKKGYIDRMLVDSERTTTNYECDECNEQGWIYSQFGDPGDYPKGDRCLFNKDHICTKKCDSIVRQSCKDWEGPKITLPPSATYCTVIGHECGYHTYKGCQYTGKCSFVKSGIRENHPCTYSGHACNMEALWDVAIGCGMDCPKMCCRRCSVKLCGARCNGSKEPTEIRQWHRLCKHEPEQSGYFEIIDVDGKKATHAWYEKSRGFDHVTGKAVECWREEQKE